MIPIARRAFVAATLGWAAALPLAAFAASRPHASLWYAFAFIVYGVGSIVCHQLPARSFHLWAAQMAVCARCTGIYVGAALGVLPMRLPPVRSTFSALAVAAIPTSATLVYEWTGGQMPSNWIRAAAGVPIGFVVAALVLRPPSDERRLA